MKDISNDEITGLLMADLKKAVRMFYADEIDLVMRTGDKDAPGLDNVIDQISVGQVGYGGVEYVQFKTDLEQARQGERRADKFVEHVTVEIERWASEHADFLQGLIKGPLEESGFVSDADRVKKLAALLEAKQDAFPPLLLAVYALGSGFDKVFAEQ